MSNDIFAGSGQAAIHGFILCIRRHIFCLQFFKSIAAKGLSPSDGPVAARSIQSYGPRTALAVGTNICMHPESLRLLQFLVRLNS